MKVKSITAVVLSACLAISSAAIMTGCGKKKNAYISDSFATIKWPDSKLAQMLPEPESTVGLIKYDRLDLLEVYIGSTTSEQYEKYVSSCKEKGFTENYDSGTDYYKRPYYHAENSEGYRLELEYHQLDDDANYKPMKETMTVELRSPSKKETEAETEKTTEKATEAPAEESSKTESKSESKAITDNDTVTPSFKEMMDSYEAFFDEYIDFMKKYKENPSDLSLISEYTEYLSKYSDYMSKLSAVDTDSLSAADLAYYTEVNARITKELAEVAA